MILEQPDTAILTPDDEAVLRSVFKSERLPDPRSVFEARFSTGREWESEETDDDGFTIRTKPDPTLRVYETDNGFVLTNEAPAPDPIVYLAIITSRDEGEVPGLLANAVDGIEDGFDGICGCEVVTDLMGGHGWGPAVADKVESILTE